MRNTRHLLLAITLAGAVPISCAPASAQSRTAAAISAASIGDLLASPDRSAADRANDLRRKPDAMLAFFDLRPDMVALDLSAAGGYTTELLARGIGRGGVVYGQSPPPRDPNQAPPTPAAPEGNSNPALATQAAPAVAPRPSPVALADREAKLRAAGVPAAKIVPIVRPFADPLPPELAHGSLDLVTLMFNYHDLGHLEVDRAAMDRAVFEALKPGGHFVIADHAGRPGTGISESGTLHRIEEAFLQKEVEAAGFRLEAEADFLHNPNDPRDRNTPDPPQAKDEFVLKFIKP